MPELPEVETTRRGIAPHLAQRTITKVIVRDARLRWPVDKDLNRQLAGAKIFQVNRRGKYLLIETSHGDLIMHLGMSGSLRILPASNAAQKHDHFELVFDSGQSLRLNDPRRFGAVIFTKQDPMQHKLLIDLGPEPLEKEFNANYLWEKSRGRSVSIKQFIMDSKIVVGVGNIYASEALFLANIHPTRAAGRVAAERYAMLVKSIKGVLRAAIKKGGTSLRDFTQSDGKPGYFKQKLNVYDRQGEACNVCGKPIKQKTIGQRSTFYCTHCQK